MQKDVLWDTNIVCIRSSHWHGVVSRIMFAKCYMTLLHSSFCSANFDMISAFAFKRTNINFDCRLVLRGSRSWTLARHSMFACERGRLSFGTWTCARHDEYQWPRLERSCVIREFFVCCREACIFWMITKSVSHYASAIRDRMCN